MNAEGSAEIILTELTKILLGNKKNSHTYDDASVMKGRIGEVFVKVKQVYHNANYVHRAAHQIKLILFWAATCNKEARLFFCKV